MRMAELEAHHNKYTDLEMAISTMLHDQQFPAVFSVCEKSLPHIVPAINFRKKRDIYPETPSLLAFTVVCKYGPPLFEHAVIESFFDFAKSNRLIARHEKGFLEQVEAALKREETARLLWNELDSDPGFPQRDISNEPGFDHRSEVGILEVWAELGIISREAKGYSYESSLRFSPDALTEGMCPACGVHARGRREAFYRPGPCKKCGNEGYYHILDTDCQ